MKEKERKIIIGESCAVKVIAWGPIRLPPLWSAQNSTAQRVESWAVSISLGSYCLKTSWSPFPTKKRKETLLTIRRGSQGKDHSAVCKQVGCHRGWPPPGIFTVLSALFSKEYVTFIFTLGTGGEMMFLYSVGNTPDGEMECWVRSISNQSGRLLHKQLGCNSHLETEGRSHVAGAWGGWA